jgi:ATP phosphoribosyltransferase regulatory subunit
MSAEPAQKFAALEAQAQRLLAVFARAGYEHVAPAIIQPAGLFLDVVGESLRARTYVFTDPDGAELCLRPDLTVPTCRLHLARHPQGMVPARYCYSGPTFRYQPAGADAAHPREFRQAGIESFAAPDREQDDAAVLALTVESLHEVGLSGFQLRIGDLGLFAALLEALPMPQRWRRRLRHQFWRPEAFRAELTRLTSAEALQARDLPRELMGRLDAAAPEQAAALLEEHLESTGIALIGTRTLQEIAERLITEAVDAREQPLDMKHAALLESYTSIRGPARDARKKLGALLGSQKGSLTSALDAFQRRLDLLEAAGVDMGEAEFSAEFGRNLEYYTGFVFEIVLPELGPKSPVAGGGRYDNLLAEVGAPSRVPAVGSSIHTERLLAVLEGSAS